MAVALMLWSISSCAQELWDGVSVGDSVESIQAKYPSAQRPSRPDSMVDGSKVLLVTHGNQIARATFEAQFFFRDRKLTAVALVLSPKLKLPESVATLELLLDALRAKYGAPFSVDTGDKLSTSYGLINSKAKWRNGRVDIEVLMIGMAQPDADPPRLSVTYTTLLAQETDKL